MPFSLRWGGKNNDFFFQWCFFGVFTVFLSMDILPTNWCPTSTCLITAKKKKLKSWSTNWCPTSDGVSADGVLCVRHLLVQFLVFNSIYWKKSDPPSAENRVVYYNKNIFSAITEKSFKEVFPVSKKNPFKYNYELLSFR